MEPRGLVYCRRASGVSTSEAGSLRMSQSVQNMSPSIPTLQTQRLVLRPFTMDDCPMVAELAGDEAIARTTLVIPHPYALSDAEQWIATHVPQHAEGKGVTLAITLRDGGILVGSISLHIDQGNRRAELGYWVGRPYWNRGYASEAARALVEWGFRACPINRIYAYHVAMNPASGRVLQKSGMRFEGVLRQHIVKDGVAHDCPWYGILRSDLNTPEAASHSQGEPHM
jgi:[ribosomal protein S5]-alanine N-acetyltransferase